MSADKHPDEVLAENLEADPSEQELADAASALRRIPALEAERDRHLAEHAQCMADMDGEIDRLRAEVEGLRADAERYRWMSARTIGAVPMARVQIMRRGQYVLIERDLSGAIDAARTNPAA